MVRPFGTLVRRPVARAVAGIALFLVVASTAGSASWMTASIVTLQSGTTETGNLAFLEAIDCVSVDECVGVGQFETTAGNFRAFVVSSSNGTWQGGIPVDFANLPQGNPTDSRLESVSCTSDGYCVAVGFYFVNGGARRPYTVSRVAGTWTTAQPVQFAPGVQDNTPNATLLSVSCASTSECLATGWFARANGTFEGFTVEGGASGWSTARPVQYAVGARDPDYDAQFYDASCDPTFSCLAVGMAVSSAGEFEGVHTSRSSGGWSDAVVVDFAPGQHNVARDVAATRVDCGSANLCATGGYFYSSRNVYEPWGAVRRNGTWSLATALRPNAAIEAQSSESEFGDIACGSSNTCLAVGRFRDVGNKQQAFTAWSIGGTWQEAVPVVFPNGMSAPNPEAMLTEAVCEGDGNCVVAGSFVPSGGGRAAFTMKSTSGIWSDPVRVQIATGVERALPGAAPKGVACLASSECVVVGQFTNSASKVVPFAFPFVIPTTTTTTTSTTTTTTTTTSTTSPTSTSTTTSPTSTSTTTSTTIPTLRAAPSLDTIRSLPSSSTPLDSDGMLVIGRTTNIRVSGFQPYERVQLVVASTPLVIDEQIADANGSVIFNVVLPTSVNAGNHTLVAFAPASGIGFTQPVRITSPVLPATGNSGSSTGLIGVLVLAAGFVIRRRSIG